MRWSIPLLLAAAACRADAEDPSPVPETARWLQTMDWGWSYFNHRVSTLFVRVDPAEAAIVGGTSTTGVPKDLPPSCDPDACKEFPASDTTELTLGWGELTTADASFAVGEASVVVPRGGSTVAIRVPAPDREGAVTAVLRGLRLDTDHPLDGDEACYDPAFGWHPRHIAVALEDPRRDGDELVVDVRFVFDAGLTEDPDRVCIDEVYTRAQGPMWAEVLFVVGPAGSAQTVAQEAYFPFNGNSFRPDEQVPPAPLPIDVPAGLRGWSRLEWSFNAHATSGRGAYIRTLTARIDEDTVAGHATHYSPVTQLDDFGFVFDGELVGVPLDGVVTEALSAVLPAEVDADGVPTVFDLNDPPAIE